MNGFIQAQAEIGDVKKETTRRGRGWELSRGEAAMFGWVRGAFHRLRGAMARRRDVAGRAWRRTLNHLLGTTFGLSHFNDVLAVELYALNERRSLISKKEREGGPRMERGDVQSLVPDVSPLPTPSRKPRPSADPHKLEPDLPKPIPCDAVGLALSGGGIRSAAFSLGALQALNTHQLIDRIDYLSTVSGGGYIGASLTAGMSVTKGIFPFRSSGDVRDNNAVGQLRNYSNYLMPRARSALRNALDVASILLRGILANALIVLTFLLVAALLTWFAYPHPADLLKGSFVPKLMGAVGAVIIPVWARPWLDAVAAWIGAIPWFNTAQPFFFTYVLFAVMAFALVLWALDRSTGNHANDADSWSLKIARGLLGLTIASAFLDAQPVLLHWLGEFYNHRVIIPAVLGPAVTAAVTVALFARRLGAFLETTQLSTSGFVQALRIVTQVSLVAVGLVVPLTLLVVYLHLSAWLIGAVGSPWPEWTTQSVYCRALVGLVFVVFVFQANAYSLHQFYDDRLSAAFLFKPDFRGPEPPRLENFKLSQLDSRFCPYHIINAALNVQGSREANRRGRDADFFMFTRDFVGSDLTMFACTRLSGSALDMESVDPRLDLGAAMAISGAAVSANMGSNTVRWLSPTLALLNIRLGYWLRNPRHLAKIKRRFLRPVYYLWSRFLGQFYLFVEMLNLLTEEGRLIYLSDGGHIENLGIYALLKRGCQLIIAVDAEADPAMSCASLLKLERYARIDLGVRIILPWEQIAARSLETGCEIDPRSKRKSQRHHGPHCAIGRVLYDTGAQGILLYFKSSMSGDEKDYLIDYKKRNTDFPHETTGDQFFTEEQFEVYRALGYHVVEGFFSDTDEFSWQSEGHGAWERPEDAKADVCLALGIS